MDATFRDILYFFVVDVRMRVTMLASFVRFRVAVRLNSFFLFFICKTRPVPFTVRAIVTSSDIEFNVQAVDFGFCTVLESVRRTVTLTNKSVLPQQFGFCGVPDVSNVFICSVATALRNTKNFKTY